MRSDYVVSPYQTPAGKKPFEEWLDKLGRKDHVAAGAIDSRLARIRDLGNFGDHNPVGQAVYELRIHLGPGYRIYYLFHGQKMVILLAGGDKGSQQRDIEKAHDYAADFRRRI
jgi:putative addiction module killer protein